MATKVWIASQWLGGGSADQHAINQNAKILESVEVSLSSLQATVARQAQEILRLQAMIAGLVDVLQFKVPFDADELDRAANDAWNQLAPPAAAPAAPTDPYRNQPTSDTTTEDVAAAKALLRVAEEHHFAKRFADARVTYQEVIDRFGNTKQASVARQQIENLRGS
jgi:hypothetical protein